VTVEALPQAWEQVWRAAPEAVVLIDQSGRKYSALEVLDESAQRAASLAASGVRTGSTVLMSCSPSVDLILTYIALMRLGVTIVPANTGYTDRELEYIVDDAKPVAAVVDEPAKLGWLERHGVDMVIKPALDLPQAPVTGDLVTVDPTSAAFIAYTSGTTGAPKGAVLTHANLLAGSQSLKQDWEWTAADRLVLALPLFHMHGLGICLNTLLLAGGSAVVLEKFTVDGVFDAIAEFNATMFSGVPTMYSRIAASDRVTELASLRLVMSGSAPLPISVWNRIAKRSGVQILERYGMTETVVLTSNPVNGIRKAGTVGRPIPGVELRLGEGDAVEVRGANVFSGYLDRPHATEAAFTADGWFRTGDVGSLDGDGYLSLIGRTSELIISGGFNVYPRELEDVLREHPLVMDIAVVGTPDEEWGEIVTGYVVLDESASAYSSWRDTLMAHASERLAPFKIPRLWHRLPELPRNAMGKVVRSELTPP
jgi:malonyl-CoA/methylmalonyl-CoA synthetase